MYKRLNAQIVQRIADGVQIPNDLNNRDYKEFLAWIALGNTETPADAPLTADQLGAAAADGMDKLNFDVNFDQENRIRVLEGKAAITKAQYKNALIARWKILNP
jgi:hypothetical protein